MSYEDLSQYWSGTKTKLCEPFITMDLKSFAWNSAYSNVKRCLTDAQLVRVSRGRTAGKILRVAGRATAKLKNYWMKFISRAGFTAKASAGG